MAEKLISGDNHIDLTYLPPDLWSSEAPNKWKQLAPRVEEKEDGLHWFVDDQDRGMWNGIGPGFLPYQKGMFNHIDEMKDLGFEWNSRPGAKPRPTTPELRLADLDRDGLSAEIIYGCLMINDLISEAPLRAWADKTYNDWVADFAKRSDPNRVFPLAIVPNTDPIEAAAEVRRCAKMGLRGGDLAFKRMTPPLYTHECTLCGKPRRSAGSRSRSTRPASRHCAPRTRRRWSRNTSRSGGWCARPCSSSTLWRGWSRSWRPALARNTQISTSCLASRA